MKRYKRLGLEDRVEIQVLAKRGFSNAEIAVGVRVHRTTIWRERRRNEVDTKYYYHLAQKKAEKRQRQKRKRPTRMYVEDNSPKKGE